MTQFMALNLTITAENADAVIAQLRELGATARGEAAEGVETLSSSFDRLAERLTERFGMWEVLDKLREGVHAMWEATEEADSANQRLAASLDQVGDSLASQQAAIEAVEAPLERWGFYTKSELNGALAQLIQLSGNVTQSMGALDVVVELAHYRHLDLGTAAMYVTKAMEGEVGMLGRYIPGLKDADDKIGFLREHLAAFAEADSESAMGATERLATAVKELAEAFGLAASSESGFVTGAVTLGAQIEQLTPIAKLFGDTLGYLVANLKEVLLALPGLGFLVGTIGATGKEAPGTNVAASVPMIGGLGPPGSAFPGLARALAGGGPPAISLGPTEDQQKEQEKYDKIANERAERASKAQEEAAKKLTEAANALDEVIQGRATNQGFEAWKAQVSAPVSTIASLMPAGTPFNPLTGMGGTAQAPASQSQGAALDAQLNTAWAQFQKQQEAAKTVSQSVTQAISDEWSRLSESMIQALTKAFEGHKLSGVFKDLGKSLMSGLGQMFQEQGEALLKYSAIMIPLESALSNIFSAGPAAAAAGLALIALGAAFNAIASSGASPGSGSSGGSSAQGAVSPHGVSSTSYLLPTPGSPFAAGEKYPGLVSPVFNVIGTGDPRAQSDIMQLLNNAVGRGLSAPGIAGS